MKRHTSLISYIVVTLLAIITSLPIGAQTKQDALYIYRNDGGFNAFFYDDIDRFEYSRIDTLGVEHDDYVVQEIYALDSIFRIPISAIDSIAFVTPETVYKKDIIRIDKSIAGHIIASDTVNWIRLDDNTPEKLIPQKGDKILISETGRYIPEGFGGRVTSVVKDAAGTTVTTEALQPEEAFERAVFKLAVGTKDAKETRRLTDEGTIYGSENPIELGPYKGSAKLSGSKDFVSALDLYTISGNLLGEIQYDIRPRVHARSFVTIDALAGVHFDNYMSADIDADLYTKLTGTLSTRLDVPFPSKYTFLKVQQGEEGDLLYGKVLWKTGLFSEGAGEIVLEGGAEGTLHSEASLNYYKPALGKGEWTPETDAKWTSKTGLGTGTGINYGFGDFSFTSGLFLDLSCEFANPLTKGVLGDGMRVELGVKHTMNSVALSQVSSNLWDTLWTDYLYSKLDKDDIFKGDIYASLDVYTKQFGWQTTIVKPTYPIVHEQAGAVPIIQNFSLNTSDMKILNYEATASYMLQRQLIFYESAGLVLEDEDEKVVDIYWSPDKYKFPGIDPDEVRHVFTFDPLKDKKTFYTISPVVTYLGRPILCPYYKQVFVEPAYFDIPDSIALDGEDNELELDYQVIKTNIPKQEITCDANWVELKWDRESQTLTISYTSQPEGSEDRSCTIHFTGMNTKGEVLVERDILVTQKGKAGSVKKFNVTPTPIDVPGYSTEFQGGELLRQITVTYPKSATNISLSSSDKSWLTIENSKGIGSGSDEYTISIKPNTDLKNPRQGTINVVLTKADGTSETKTVTVNQSAFALKVEMNPPEVILEAADEEGAKYSDTQTVNIEITPYDSFIASLIKNQEVKPNIEWIEATRNGSTIKIRGEANPMNEDRTNTVTYTLTLTTGDVFERVITVTQLKPGGDPSVIDAGTFHFPSEGGESTREINVPNVVAIKTVHSMNDWIGIIGSGLKFTVTCKENTNASERVGVVGVVVTMKDGTEATLFYQITQDEGTPDYTDIASINFYLKVKELYYSNDEAEGWLGDYEKEGTVSADLGEIKTSLNGSKGMHVDCNQTIVYNRTTYKYVVSFDIDNIYGIKDRTAKIQNVYFHLNESDSTEDYVSVGEDGIRIASLPMNGKNQWGGTAGGGVVFSDFVNKTTTTSFISDEYSWSGYAKLVDDPGNMARISINFK